METRIANLEEKIRELESRINKLERKTAPRAISKMRFARIREMIELGGGRVAYMDVKNEFGLSHQAFTHIVKGFLRDPNYMTLVDPDNKARNYFVKRGYKFNGKPVKTVGFVYLVRAKNGLYKIGSSIDPEKRLNGLKTGSPDKLIIIHTIKTDSAYEAERTFHKKFEHKKVHDEWFALDERDVEFIRSIETVSDDTLRLLSL